MSLIDKLPCIMELNDYSGDYDKYIEALYEVYLKDFIHNKTKYQNEPLRLKRNPIVHDKDYTFYHITHSGDIESERVPDLRRCERLCWAKPIIENCHGWRLKIWTQVRRGKGGTKNRIAIWLEVTNDIDYMIILDVRTDFKLLWTTFTIEHNHEKKKRLKEYNEWVKNRNRQA